MAFVGQADGSQSSVSDLVAVASAAAIGPLHDHEDRKNSSRNGHICAVGADPAAQAFLIRLVILSPSNQKPIKITAKTASYRGPLYNCLDPPHFRPVS